MQKIVILFYCLVFILPVLAQPQGTSHIQQYTTDNGLPSNGIKGLQWDEKTEFLWMATEAGIVRFNGVDFKSYTKENMPAIGSERMLFIIRNHGGNIYVSDQPGNIFAINKSKPVLWHQANNSLSVNPYLKNYYLLSVSEAFFKKNALSLNPNTFATTADKIACINDTAFIILNQGSIFYNAIGLSSPVPIPFEQGPASTIFKIDSNYFIRNSKKDFFHFNPRNKTFTPIAINVASGVLNPGDNNFLFWQTGMRKPIFIAGQNAWELNFDGHKIIAELSFSGIPPDTYIKSIQYSEKNKLLFVGTESKGLIVIHQNRVQSKKRKETTSKNRNSYYSQIELDNGNILTNESDIIGDNTAASTLPVKGKFSFNISTTDSNLLWYNQTNTVPGYNCLYRYNKTTRQTTVFEKISNGEMVTASGNSIYLANLNGIGVLEADSMRYLYHYPKEITGTVSFDFAEISPGILAVATCSGLLRYNISTAKLDTIFNKQNICVRSIWKYKGYIFFGTYGSGFYMYKNDRIQAMPMDKSKYLLYTHCFAPDEQGYCWISTNRGLFKSSLEELINFFEEKTATVYYHYFGKKDGMDMTELNGGCTPCALLLKNKVISFPTMDGLLWVDPAKALPVLPTGEIFIDEILIDNKKINEDSLAYKNLPASTGEILIHLGFSAWCNKENIYMDYQLNDTLHWKPVNTDNDAVIRLINLPSGNYKLRIRKLNGFGQNTYSYKVLRFTISTPWHKQWWFFVLSLLTLMGITALFFHLRTRQYKIREYKLQKQVAEKTSELQQQNEILEKNNSIKTRLISIISHDIVTPLKFVTVAGKNLIEKRNVMPEELQQETIQEITNTSQELQLLSTNILNWIKYQNENRRLAKENFNLHEMTNQVLGVLYSLAKQKNLFLVNAVDKELELYQYFEPLKILVYNLITNAINFSEKGRIIIAAELAGDNITVSVTDEGVGMTADQIKNIMADQFIVSSANIDNRKGNGLGYLIIKDLVKTMNAKLQISSEKGKGTRVSIAMRINRN
jgi:signal transduction histidine kinase